MRIMATLWAFNGAPVDWNDAPFEAHYQGFGIDACQIQKQECHFSKLLWWNAKEYQSQNSHQKQAYNNVRSSVEAESSVRNDRYICEINFTHGESQKRYRIMEYG
ncbi:putative xyloglucan endotransglucosylase/hydrolase protein 1 [Spatholobus suberectus]|nr:putative xyloglucan endotransglucosylase/hydrolase protein 1 [Spatholobus suberectus]